MPVKTVYTSKVTYVILVFENWIWFWCSIIACIDFAAICSENTECGALWEIPVHFLLSPSLSIGYLA